MSLSLFPDTIELPLLHPVTKEPIGFVLDLVSTDHDDVYQASIDVIKAMRNKGEKEPTDVALSLDLKIKVAAACIVGWTITSDEVTAIFTNPKDKKGLGFTDASYSPEKAVALMSIKTAGWIRSQIETAISDRTRFFKSASAS